MSGDEMLFDPNMTKKKKKKKKPFILEEEGGDGVAEDTLQVEAKGVEPNGGEDREFDLDEDEGRKKGEQSEAAEEVDLDLQLPAKKKKSKKVDFHEEGEIIEKDDALEDDAGKNNKGISFSSQSGPAWVGTDRDYTYDELLNRVFNIMREKNPDMVAGEKRKFVMKPPQVVRVGTKKTSFVNFTDICKLGSIDGNNQLVIKGRFQQKQIENVLRRYIKEYVTCHTCHSPDTILQKDTRLYFLQCETCHSRCSVASIKTGFQAVTGKRAQLRAKAN
ncbi:unnamed protein product [Coregonus sp. 'balchen']|nr:unnamed protein product [Coregonus sp. 'balchen']